MSHEKELLKAKNFERGAYDYRAKLRRKTFSNICTKFSARIFGDIFKYKSVLTILDYQSIFIQLHHKKHLFMEEESFFQNASIGKLDSYSKLKKMYFCIHY